MVSSGELSELTIAMVSSGELSELTIAMVSPGELVLRDKQSQCTYLVILKRGCNPASFSKLSAKLDGPFNQTYMVIAMVSSGEL